MQDLFLEDIFSMWSDNCGSIMGGYYDILIYCFCLTNEVTYQLWPLRIA